MLEQIDFGCFWMVIIAIIAMLQACNNRDVNIIVTSLCDTHVCMHIHSMVSKQLW